MEFDSWNILWSICFGIVAFLIIVGNAFTIFIFSKRKLRKRPHILLINLAIADLMVGLVSIPIFVTFHNSYMTRLLLLVFDCADMLVGLASVFIIAVISLERMHAIGKPLRHRFLSSRAYLLAIATPWFLAALVSSSRLLLNYSIIARLHFVAIVMVSLTTPLLITIFCYGFIWKTLKARLPNPHRNTNDDKLAKTMLLVTAAFIITWFPFEILVLAVHLCVPCQRIPVSSVYIIKLFHFSNSLINIVIYHLRIPEFRENFCNFLRITCCSCTKCFYQTNHLDPGISVISMTTIIGPFESLGNNETEQVTSL